MDFRQIKTGLCNYTPISEDIIEKIACIKAFEDVQMNNRLYEHHKSLLRYSKYKNGDKEVGFFWDLNNVEKECLRIKGNMNGFSIHDNPQIYELINNPYNIASVVIMHNHPRNGLFSWKDITSFTDFNSIYLMTAVCNDGTIYMLRKEYNFNPFLMKQYYNNGVKLSKNIAYEERIKKAKKLNLDINNDFDKINEIPTKQYYYGIKNVAKYASTIGVTYRCSVKRK